MKKSLIQKIKNQFFCDNFQDLIEHFKTFISNDKRFWKYQDKWPNNLIKNYNQISINQNFCFNILGKNIRHSKGSISINDLDLDCFELWKIIKDCDIYYSIICIGIIQDKYGPQLVLAIYNNTDRNANKPCIYNWIFVNPKTFKTAYKYGFIDILN